MMLLSRRSPFVGLGFVLGLATLSLSPAFAQEAAPAAPAEAAAPADPAAVVATVNGKNITEADLSLAEGELSQQFAQLPPEQRRAAALSDVIGKSIPFAVITEDVLRGGLQQAGLPDFVVDAVADIKRDFLTGKYDIITTDVERLSGRKPTTLRNFLAEALK